MTDERLQQLEETMLFLERQVEQHAEAIEELTGRNRRLEQRMAELAGRLETMLNPPEQAVDDPSKEINEPDEQPAG